MSAGFQTTHRDTTPVALVSRAVGLSLALVLPLAAAVVGAIWLIADAREEKQPKVISCACVEPHEGRYEGYHYGTITPLSSAR
jgi:hypothetical protein